MVVAWRNVAAFVIEQIPRFIHNSSESLSFCRQTPHVPALEELGVPGEEIARVHRPIGLNIGSRTPAEIAISTMAGLIADRNGRQGGFSFDLPS